MRTEFSVSLTLAWDARKPLTEDDTAILRRFLAAVEQVAGLRDARVSGNLLPLRQALGVPQNGEKENETHE